jgi:hypothetical protein
VDVYGGFGWTDGLRPLHISHQRPSDQVNCSGYVARPLSTAA